MVSDTFVHFAVLVRALNCKDLKHTVTAPVTLKYSLTSSMSYPLKSEYSNFHT